MRNHSIPPEYDWFKAENYRAICNFDFADWVAMLGIRRTFEHASAADRAHHFAPDAAKELTTVIDETEKARSIWDKYLEVALPCNYRKVPARGRTLPLLEDISEQIASLRLSRP
jgi:hypothetical protein